MNEPIELTKRHEDQAANAAKETATDRFEVLHEIVAKLSTDLHAVKGELAANTAFTKDVMKQSDATKLALEELAASLMALKNGVGDLIEILTAMKGLFKVAGWAGAFIKWAALITAPLIAIWYSIKGGGRPHE